MEYSQSFSFFPSQKFCFLKKVFSKNNLKNSTNNIISVEAAKALQETEMCYFYGKTCTNISIRATIF
jgi:hypothetical protein